MKRIVYWSKASLSFELNDLLKLAKEAMLKNEQYDVTGFLQYKNNVFFQYLEGTSDNLNSIIGSISKDPRHQILRIIQLPSEQERLFSKWKMRYVEEDLISPVGLPDLINDLLRKQDNPVYNDEYMVKRLLRLLEKLVIYYKSVSS